MSFGPVDLLFNIVVLLLWFRVWNGNQRVMELNPYLSSPATFTQPVLDLFRAALGGGSAVRAAMTAWLVLILFRGLALPALNPEGVRQAWSLRLGFESIIPAARPVGGVFLFITFSFLSFGIFLFQVWGFALLFLKDYRPGRVADRTEEFLYAIARPFSDAPPRYRPWILLGYGMALVAIMNLAVGGWAAVLPGAAAGPVRLALRYATTTVAGVVDLLLILRTLLIILIIGSWVVLFTGAQALMIVCREWLDFLLGPFRRFPIRLGPLDLTPIVAFMALGIVHWLLNGNILLRLYIAVRNVYL